jgi:hypothetical protein
MTPAFGRVFRLFQRVLLRGASLLVPRRQRAEWWREWDSERWHVRQSYVPLGATSWQVSWQAECAVTSFCLGAFKDALCLRRHSRQKEPFASLRGSAAQCILWLVAALAASYAISLLLPGVRAENQPSRYQVNSGLILIQDARVHNDSVATIPLEQYREWKGRTQRYFDGLAFYRINKETVSTGVHAQVGWEVAHASSNLFALLGLPVRFIHPDGDADGNMPRLILSDEVWKGAFGGNPQIVGSVLRVGRYQARIVGVVPNGAWRLPGKADAWLLEPDYEIDAGGMGHVVAHLTLLGQSEMQAPHVEITARDPDDAEDDLWGASLEERTRGPWDNFLFAIFLALLALPAITSVSTGEYGLSVHQPSWSGKLCRWGFLCAKLVLLLPIVYFSSLDLAYWHTAFYSLGSEYVQLVSSFSICLFGLRWVLLDQRQRCPVCLKVVTNPAQVGQASRTFLAWNGTEMMCLGGHTLLHVPGFSTSWFSTQRWLYLDTSWGFLFAGSGAGMKNEAITGSSTH